MNLGLQHCKRLLSIGFMLLVAISSIEPQAAPTPAPSGSYEFPNIPAIPSIQVMTAVPTFEAVGLYWTAEFGSANNEGLLRYREVGSSAWKQAQSLWFDARVLPDAPARSLEYRGSIVGLKPGTQYEVQAFVDGVGEIAGTTFTTWSENFPIARIVDVSTMTGTLNITESGSPTGYVLYTGAPGTTLDGGGTAISNIYVTASYIIIRGLTLVNAKNHGIYLENGSHDVVIENNDISGWGEIAPDGWGMELDSAIVTNWQGDTSSIKRIIIQRNKLHNPRSSSNNWNEPRPYYGGDSHPYGPQGISFFDTGGNHVIRYNEIYGDDTHHFSDGFGGARNFSWAGSPGVDSDIYGNKIMYAWDDCIEAEGANQNVRIWGNYLDNCYVMIAQSSSSIGPVYDFRNVMYRNLKAPGVYRGNMFKLQSYMSTMTTWGGRVYIYHNTAYRTGDIGGIQNGISCSYASITNTISRNNIIAPQPPDNNGFAIWDGTFETSNSFDYDLYRGTISAAPGAEAHGVFGSPTYDPSSASGPYTLSPSSLGFDAGVRLPNFNDTFYGAGPDMGAQENGAPPLKFGVQ